MATTGPRYFGFVNGATLPIALASGWLGMAWDHNAALPVMSPVAARLHEITRNWLVQLFGLPDTSVAAFVTGTTMATAAALTAARDHQLAGLGWDVQRQGLYGAPALTVVAGEKAHSTLLKALGLIGAFTICERDNRNATVKKPRGPRPSARPPGAGGASRASQRPAAGPARPTRR